jgi:hypothetical protein
MLPTIYAGSSTCPELRVRSTLCISDGELSQNAKDVEGALEVLWHVLASINIRGDT